MCPEHVVMSLFITRWRWLPWRAGPLQVLHNEPVHDPTCHPWLSSLLLLVTVLLACRIHVDGALLPPDTSAANATVASSTGTKHSAADSRAQQEEALEVAKHLLATLGGLIELDISGATFLSANCMIHLLKSCGQLKKLGVAGCTTLAAEGEAWQSLLFAWC